MCGRFAQPRSADELARLFHATPATDLAGERFNVAPTDPVAAVVEHHGERVVDAFRWGLVPVYADSPRGAARLINARSETAERSPAFRASFRRQRCIVPADAFYEWLRTRDPSSGRVMSRQPYAIRPNGDDPFAFAGLWATWHDPDTAERLYTVSILTGPPNELVEAVHDRMPVILPPDAWDAWLDIDTPTDELRGLLRPAPADGMRMYAVSPAVNNVRSQGAELLQPFSRWQADGAREAEQIGLWKA
ncbi:MAG TPA: SOS response-associated peptidase [Candidatus Limnocylindria bacterium]